MKDTMIQKLLLKINNYSQQNDRINVELIIDGAFEKYTLRNRVTQSYY